MTKLSKKDFNISKLQLYQSIEPEKTTFKAKDMPEDVRFRLHFKLNQELGLNLPTHTFKEDSRIVD